MSSAPPTVIDDAAAARSEMFGLLADAFDFPSREFHEQVGTGAFRERVVAAVRQLPYELTTGVDMAAFADAGEYVDFQGEYMRLFDVGAVRPPCPLYGGEWGGTRKRAMEEAVRFYRFFGMKMDQSVHELPDHVTVELEFLQVMA